MVLDIAYYQLNQTTKRIVMAQLVYDDYSSPILLRPPDKDYEYTLDVTYYPLDWAMLIIKFAYDDGIFFVLYFVIGFLNVGVCACYWLLIRSTTELENPRACGCGACSR